MTPEAKHSLRWGFALVILLIGIFSSALTWRSTTRTADAIAENADYLRRIESMKQPVLDAQQTLDMIALLENATLASPDQLVRLAGITDKASVRILETVSLQPGWEQHTIEISATDIPQAALTRLLKQAESQRPPWRLTSCNLSGSALSKSLITARLSFEGIQPASR